MIAQYTQNICRPITFMQRRPNVFDFGPTLYKCYTNDTQMIHIWLLRGGLGMSRGFNPRHAQTLPEHIAEQG